MSPRARLLWLIHEALKSAYPDPGPLGTFLLHEMDFNLVLAQANRPAELDLYSHLIHELERQGKLQEFLQKASNSNRNPKLREAFEFYTTALGETSTRVLPKKLCYLIDRETHIDPFREQMERALTAMPRSAFAVVIPGPRAGLHGELVERLRSPKKVKGSME